MREKIQKKYEDMKRVLDEDLHITLTQLDTEREAVERLVEERIEVCRHLSQDLNLELDNLSAHVKNDAQEVDIQVQTKGQLLWLLMGHKIVYCLKLFCFLFYDFYRTLKQTKGTVWHKRALHKNLMCQSNKLTHCDRSGS